ncbi:hypothetical protein A0H76_143 [Hepatospora eriocheir]|uniref:Uncharacterized protein n=1 Tax=Hepatospora eriocheir TaxID=1081669 RepID=A0A1X0QLF3_9MICR|nr:hypothetical protein HERIO_964 [Hepatospora eriocheir]ORE00544.1 hypothetical protein A0H76_143 [Hepatospora eriocheir]
MIGTENNVFFQNGKNLSKPHSLIVRDDTNTALKGLTYEKKIKKLNFGEQKEYFDSIRGNDPKEILRPVLLCMTIVYWALFATLFYGYHESKILFFIEKGYLKTDTIYEMTSHLLISTGVYGVIVYGIIYLIVK